MPGGNYKSLGRSILRGLDAPGADAIRRRDTLNVERALGDAAADTAATKATIADITTRLEALQTLLEYLADPSQVPLMWAHLQTDGAGAVDLQDGHGIASAILVGDSVQLTFAAAVATTSFAVAGSRMTGSVGGMFAGSETQTTVLVGIWNAAGQLPLSTTAADFGVVIMGRRPV